MTLDDRLRNWGRWARVGIKLAQCGSAEGNYRSNWRQWVAVADITHPEPCDAFDAEEVEAAWVRMSNYREKKLLKLKYVWLLQDEGYRGDDGRLVLGICERIRINPTQLDAWVARSRHHIKYALDAGVRKDEIRLTSFGLSGMVAPQFDPLPSG